LAVFGIEAVTIFAPMMVCLLRDKPIAV